MMLNDNPPPKPERWLLESVRFFRQLGFFARHSALPDEALARMLDASHREEWGVPLDGAGDLADLQLLKWDEDRVWWEDIEADICDGNQVYIEVLQAWSRISRGAFLPARIQERWESE